MTSFPRDTVETEELLRQAVAGNESSFRTLFEAQHEQLSRFVQIRMDLKLRQRFDPADIVQDTYLEAVSRLDDFMRRRPMPFPLWLRKNALERIFRLRREHVVAQRRSLDREQRRLDASTYSLVGELAAKGLSPSEHIARKELNDAIADAIDNLGDVDRELLLLRHVEGFSHAEIGCVLELEEATARKRYGRVLRKLQQAIVERGIDGKEQ